MRPLKNAKPPERIGTAPRAYSRIKTAIHYTVRMLRGLK